MLVVMLEDYQRAVRSLECFQLLEGFDVQVYHYHASDPEVLAERFASADAMVLTRERTRIDAALLQRLPKSARPGAGRAAYRSAGPTANAA